jgi:hypothetical protein
MALVVSKAEGKLELLQVRFNQDEGCFAAATTKGFRIFNADPYKETFHRGKARRQLHPSAPLSRLHTADLRSQTPEASKAAADSKAADAAAPSATPSPADSAKAASNLPLCFAKHLLQTSPLVLCVVWWQWRLRRWAVAAVVLESLRCCFGPTFWRWSAAAHSRSGPPTKS